MIFGHPPPGKHNHPLNTPLLAPRKSFWMSALPWLSVLFESIVRKSWYESQEECLILVHMILSKVFKSNLCKLWYFFKVLLFVLFYIEKMHPRSWYWWQMDVPRIKQKRPGRPRGQSKFNFSDNDRTFN